MDGTLQAAPNGRHQPGVLVRDHQLDPGQAPDLELAQESPPEGLVLGVAELESEDLLVSLGGQPPWR
jgi:hypothetical protein